MAKILVWPEVYLPAFDCNADVMLLNNFAPAIRCVAFSASVHRVSHGCPLAPYDCVLLGEGAGAGFKCFPQADRQSRSKEKLAKLTQTDLPAAILAAVPRNHSSKRHAEHLRGASLRSSPSRTALLVILRRQILAMTH